MATNPACHQRMARDDAPLQLSIQPSVGTPTLEAAQDAAADEDAERHTQDDERRRQRDRAEHPGQGAPTSRPAAPDRPQQIQSSSAVRPRTTTDGG